MKTITPAILAAGDSSRMGYPKALLPLDSGTFLSRILDVLASLDLDEPRVILGSHELQIRPLLDRRKVSILVNPEPARGQSSSIRMALQTLPPNCAGCLIWPVDLPLVPVTLVRDLVRLFLDSDCRLALPRCAGKAGHPAIFGPALIQEVLAAPSGANPKTIIAGYTNATAWLDTGEMSVIEDIDTPEDYRKLTGQPSFWR